MILLPRVESSGRGDEEGEIEIDREREIINCCNGLSEIIFRQFF